MERPFILLPLLISAGTLAGQFFPESNATWCMLYGTQPNTHRQLELIYDLDTVIGGNAYMRIEEYSDLPGQWQHVYTHHVRNEGDAKGYLWHSETQQEYLVGDLGALPGDTVHDVFVFLTGPGDPELFLFDIVVDSIVMLNNLGVSVVRHYVDFPDHPAQFWQAGAGTSFGPALRGLTMDGPLPTCMVMNDTVLFNAYQQVNGVSWQPGGDDCCAPIAMAVGELGHSGVVRIYPNPTPGRITMEFPDPLLRESYYSVYDALGRLLYQRPLPTGANVEEVDLSRFGRGAYVLRVTDPEGQRHTRVVVE